MALTDWVQTVAVIYFAWQQNRIFQRQNEILANQAGDIPMPAKTSQARWIDWIRRYWPTFIMVVLMVVTAYDIYARHGAPPVIPLWFYVLLLFIVFVIGLIGRLTTVKSEPLTAVQTPPPKLMIHRAVYAAGLPTEVLVTDKLNNLVRDCIAITVDSTLGGILPSDPASGVCKRLDVEYSYGSDTRFPVSRWERPAGEIMRLVLPEDTEVKRLDSEVTNLKQRPISASTETIRKPDSSWVRFITAYPEIVPPPEPGKEPVKKPQKIRCEFLNCMDFSYKVKVVSWDCGNSGLPADFWRGCLQLRIGTSWCPEWNGVEELHVPSGESFRMWLYPRNSLSDNLFKERVISGNLGTVHLLLNGKEIAVSIG